MSKTLVAYFSASGTTRRAAQRLADAIGADQYEIRPAVAYTAADLNWQDKHSRSSVEMNDPAARPALADTDANIAAYDRIFLGFPIWWYTAPSILFATSGGSGLGKTAQALASSCPGAEIRTGKMLNGMQDAASLRRWAESL